ncbi:MAG: acyltransferase family protein [bacterium]|nr:acyltransferase family protein [bacterium]
MTISINNPVESTYIFAAILLVAIIVWTRRRRGGDFFPPEATQELKGLAILAIVFSHIGYFLISGQKFLFPLSVMAGVGVNLFLFLSGYGLTASSIKSKFTWKKIGQFYRCRWLKLFMPFWLTLAVFFLLDYFLLDLNYGLSYLVQSFLGFFPRADLYNDVNSPLWYFSLILFYYLLFPLVFLLRNHRLSALAVYLITYLIIWLNPGYLSQVMHLYKVHILAFPLGMLFASLYYEPNNFLNQVVFRIRSLVSGSSSGVKYFKKIFYWIFVIILLAIAVYTADYSNIGSYKEEFTSIITMSALIILFLIKKINFGFLYIVGVYSYEIYLLHWPILYRYEMFYGSMPAWLATALYLLLFLILGLALKKVSEVVLKFFNRGEKIVN